MPLGPGTLLGSYEIQAALGAGAMGEVYRARDVRLGRDIAIKVLPAHVAADPDRRERFAREARIVAGLNHPSIVTIHSVEESHNTHFLTMELVEGRTLWELIPKSGMPLGRLLEIAVPLADAIAAAHQKGVTHRDLKPANLMVREDGRVKVLDFGLAKLREDAAQLDAIGLPSQVLTGEGRIVGTAAYMSPEQAEGKPVDHRSDIFSLGVVLYEMATGELPFKGDTPLSMLSSLMKDTPAPVTILNPAIPRELGRIIRRCVTKDPERRYQSAKDVRNELDDLKQELQSGELFGSGVPSPISSAGHHRLRAIMVAVGVVALGAVSGLVFVSRNRGIQAPASTGGTIGGFKQLTSQSGVENFPTLSPDGKWILYSKATGNADIYLQGVGGHIPIDLTKDSPAEDTEPAFSPDGEQIAFRSERQGGGIFVMGRTGESARRLTDRGFNPAWSPDGKEILFASENITGTPYWRASNSEIGAVNVATGTQRRVFHGDAVQPQWSPHGHRIAYWSILSPKRDPGQRDIWTIPATGGTPLSVTNDAPVDWNPVWSPDGRYLYFLSDRGGSMNVWRVSIDETSGKTLRDPDAVTTPSPYTGFLSFSADGRLVAYASSDITSNIQQVALDPRIGKVQGAPADVTSGSRRWSGVDVSRDGQWLAFQPWLQQEDIFVVRTDGTGLRQLTSDPANDRTPRWAPDGRRIAFYSNRDGRYQIWTLNPDGGALTRLTAFRDNVVYPVWSPDGSRLAVTHGRSVGNKVYIVRTGESWEKQRPEELPALTVGGEVFLPSSWSRDGHRLAGYGDGPSAGIILYSVARRTYERLTRDGTAPIWLNDNRRLIYVDKGKLFLLDSASKQSRELLALPHGDIATPALASDNQRIYFVRQNIEADVWLATLGQHQRATGGGR
jgi:eukaryotic-like serine/threonine-protein kinase